MKTTFGLILLVIVAASGHIPGAASPPPDNDCQVHVIATDGIPPPGTPTIDPQKLCDALKRAELEGGS